MTKRLWTRDISLEELQTRSKDTFSGLLGVEFTEIGADFMEARLKVEPRLYQPFGILHGGVSVALAETIGSVAANCAVDLRRARCVGQAIDANHLRPVSGGYLHARASPFSVEERIHVWGVEIRDDSGALTCICRLTMAVLAQ
jgi:1,4-dihydroxy-2-naphthoyl-CoA hydrolase